MRPVAGLILSTDLHDGFTHPGPAYVDLAAMTAWDTSHDTASPARTVFEALTGRYPGRFTTVHDLDRPGTVFLTVALLHLTDEITDAILSHHRANPTTNHSATEDRQRGQVGDIGRPHGQPEHDCLTTGRLDYVADYGAPGIGQAWTCTVCDRAVVPRRWRLLAGRVRCPHPLPARRRVEPHPGADTDNTAPPATLPTWRWCRLACAPAPRVDQPNVNIRDRLHRNACGPPATGRVRGRRRCAGPTASPLTSLSPPNAANPDLAAFYLLVNGAGTPQSTADLARAATVAAG